MNLRLTVRGVTGRPLREGGCGAACGACGARWRTRSMEEFTRTALAHVCGDDPVRALLREVVTAVGVESLPAGLAERLRAAGVVEEAAP